MLALEFHVLAVHSDPRPFAQANDGLVVELMELFDARLAGFSHVGASFYGVKVMRVDVERDPAESLKARRVNDWHVIGSANADAGQVASC